MSEVGQSRHFAGPFRSTPISGHIPRLTIWIYVDTSKPVGDPDHLKVFANEDAAERWFAENDREDDVAFGYEVLE
jgi:hypothetical protein